MLSALSVMYVCNITFSMVVLMIHLSEDIGSVCKDISIILIKTCLFWQLITCWNLAFI